VIGYDHRFGLNRAGNINYLKAYEKNAGFEVIEIEKQMVEQILISSTRIRNYLVQAEIETANKLAGHPYLMIGIVVRGHQIGEKLGYPTANIRLNNPLKLVPPEGIYAAYVLVSGKRYGGMLYIGNRPTVSQQGKQSIEVHIFNFNGDIYHQSIQIEILKFIRPDKVFPNIEGLKNQLDLDKVNVLVELEKIHQRTNLESAIVILNYNGLHHLKRFIPSIIQHSKRKSGSIVVADNASTDASVQWLTENYPEVAIIQLEENYGYAGGYNEALKTINAKYLFLINSDIEVTDQWMEPLITAMEKDMSLGACQPKIKSYLNKDTFEYAGAAGGLLDIYGYPFCRGRILSEVEQDFGQYEEEKEIFWVTGAAMCIRKKAFHDFGGFDADFFAHMEEIDLCWRMKQAGYKMKVVPDSVVYHEGGGTLSYLSPRKTFLNFRNGLCLLIKNEKGLKLIWLLPLRIILDFIAGIRFLLVKEYGNSKAVMKAMLSNAYHFFYNYGKRRKTLKQVRTYSIGPPNLKSGRYHGSIIWEFFIRGKKKYSDLRKTVMH
jgi:GT2 family glycosyltransferase